MVYCPESVSTKEHTLQVLMYIDYHVLQPNGAPAIVILYPYRIPIFSLV